MIGTFLMRTNEWNDWGSLREAGRSFLKGGNFHGSHTHHGAVRWRRAHREPGHGIYPVVKVFLYLLDLLSLFPIFRLPAGKPPGVIALD